MSNHIASLYLTDEKIVETTTTLEQLRQQRQKILITMDISDAIFLLNEGRKPEDCLQTENVQVRDEYKIRQAVFVYTPGEYKVGFLLRPSPVPSLVSEGVFQGEIRGLYFINNKTQTLGYGLETSGYNKYEASPELEKVCIRLGINLIVGYDVRITHSKNPTLEVISTNEKESTEELFSRINIHLRHNLSGRRIESFLAGISLFGSKNEPKAPGDHNRLLRKCISISLLDGKIHELEGNLNRKELFSDSTREPATWYERAEDRYDARKNFDHSDGDG